MTAFLLAVKSQPKVHPSSDTIPLTLESLIAVPSHTPEGRRVHVIGDKVFVDSRVSRYLGVHLLIGNLLTIAWLCIDMEYSLVEYFVPFIHFSIYATFLWGNKDTINWMLAVIFVVWVFVTKLFCERVVQAVPYVGTEFFWNVLNPQDPMFYVFTWPIMRAFFLMIMSLNTFFYGIIKLHCKWDEENIEQMIRRRTEEAFDLV